jgi:hypothetical protein
MTSGLDTLLKAVASKCATKMGNMVIEDSRIKHPVAVLELGISVDAVFHTINDELLMSKVDNSWVLRPQIPNMMNCRLKSAMII